MSILRWERTGKRKKVQSTRGRYTSIRFSLMKTLPVHVASFSNEYDMNAIGVHISPNSVVYPFFQIKAVCVGYRNDSTILLQRFYFVGGYTAAPTELVQLLRQKSRPYLFSNSCPPPIVASASKVSPKQNF